MRYAILSDVHGNLESLQRALDQVPNEHALLCLGDIVGYGPNPNECARLIRDRATDTVLGNHDVAALDNFGVEYFNSMARKAIEWTQGVLDADVLAWLNGLSYESRHPGFLLVHGAPVNYFEYILDKRGAAKAFERTDAPVVFVGHTHIAEYYALEADGTISHRHMQQGGTLQLEEGKRYIVDVGSVGQPRDLNPDPSFVLFDDEVHTIKWVRYAYCIGEVQEKIREAHLPESLAARLQLGR